MKGFWILAAVIVCTMSSPQNRRRRDTHGHCSEKKEKDPGMIIRCMAENWGEETKIQECILCFAADMDLDTQAGINAAVDCANRFLQEGVVECSSKIAELIPGDEEQIETILECFDDRLEKSNAERCLNEAQATEVEAKLTEGSMCVLDSWKFAFGYVKNQTRPRRRGGRRQGGGRRFGKDGRMKRMMAEMIISAHCDLANEDNTREEECIKCFKDALPTKLVGRRRRRGADTDVVEALTSCSRSNLTPLYDTCTDLMKDRTDMKAAQKCYNRILIGSLVSDCVDEKDIKTSDANSLTEVIHCGTENAFVWLSERNPQAADMLGTFLERMGDHDGHDDDD